MAQIMALYVCVQVKIEVYADQSLMKTDISKSTFFMVKVTSLNTSMSLHWLLSIR